MFRPGRPGRGSTAASGSQRKSNIQKQVAASSERLSVNMEDTESSATTPLLNAYKTHIEDMRNLIMCKICIRPLYEPFSLGECGHTYCYSCLSEWFSNKPNRKKRSCPDCRADVKVQPAPNYLLRELVHMFMSRAELLPKDETIQEHHEAMMSEARIVEKDKSDKSAKGGLFKGVFRHSNYWNQLPQRVLRDHEDGVDRCPMCSWELEEGLCGHCGFDVDDGEDFSDEDGHSSLTDYNGRDFGDSEDLDGDIDLDDDDAFGYDFAFHQAMRMPHRFGDAGVMPGNAIPVDDVALDGFWPSGVSHSDDGNSAEEDEDDSEMDDFIDDDEEDDREEAEEENYSDNDTIRSAVPRSPISVSSAFFPPSPGHSAVSISPTNESEEGVEHGHGRASHSAGLRNDDSEATESSEEEQEEEEEEEEEGEEEDDDDVMPVARRKRTTTHNTWPRRQRIIIDSDSEEGNDGEDDDGEPTTRGETRGSSEEQEQEASGATLISSPSPPRSAAARRARRQAQRTRSRMRRS